MPSLNYTRRLQNLADRRFDPTLQKSVLTESFSRAQIPEDLKYLAESMQPIGNDYNEKTVTAANNVRTHLERDFQLSFSRAYRYQGSVMTQTNIKTHSDIDLLAVIDSYFYPAQNSNHGNNYEGDPTYDINELRRQTIKILKSKYDEVDDTGSKSIAIYNKNLRRKVDIVPCYWFNSESYVRERDEYYRGVFLYDFEQNKRAKKDFPFAHIQQVQSKGNNTNDGLRKGIRLLKTLKADSEERIKLSSFQLTTIVFRMDNSLLNYVKGLELRIAENISGQIDRLINEPTSRKELLSPNGIERPLYDDNVIPQLRELKKDLDLLINDCKSDLRNNYFEKSFREY